MTVADISDAQNGTGVYKKQADHALNGIIVVAAVSDFFVGCLLLYNGGSLRLLPFYCLRDRHRCAFAKFFVPLNRLLPPSAVEKLFKRLNTRAITIETMLVRSDLATQRITLIGMVC
jgi:hypothetical protein